MHMTLEAVILHKSLLRGFLPTVTCLGAHGFAHTSTCEWPLVNAPSDSQLCPCSLIQLQQQLPQCLWPMQAPWDQMPMP